MVDKQATRRSSTGYHHGDLRRALLESGLALLEQADGSDPGLRELARMAGVAPASVYRHFANKEDLLVALAVEGFIRLTAEQISAYRDNMQQQGSPLSAFRAGGLAYIRFARRHPALFRLMFGRFSAIDDNAALIQARRDNGDALMKAVGRMLPADTDKRRLRSLCVGAWSTIHGLSALILDRNLSESGDDLDQLVVSVIEGVSSWGSDFREAAIAI